MDAVMVAVKMNNESVSYDYELPATVPAKELAKAIAKILHIEKSESGQDLRYSIRVDSQNKVLLENETLAEAGVWDGSMITLVL